MVNIKVQKYKYKKYRKTFGFYKYLKKKLNRIGGSPTFNKI